MANWIKRVNKLGEACGYKEVTSELLRMLIIYIGLTDTKVKDDITKEIKVLEVDLTEKLCREKQNDIDRIKYSKETNKKQKKVANKPKENGKEKEKPKTTPGTENLTRVIWK